MRAATVRQAGSAPNWGNHSESTHRYGFQQPQRVFEAGGELVVDEQAARFHPGRFAAREVGDLLLRGAVGRRFRGQRQVFDAEVGLHQRQVQRVQLPAGHDGHGFLLVPVRAAWAAVTRRRQAARCGACR